MYVITHVVVAVFAAFLVSVCLLVGLDACTYVHIYICENIYIHTLKCVHTYKLG